MLARGGQHGRLPRNLQASGALEENLRAGCKQCQFRMWSNRRFGSVQKASLPRGLLRSVFFSNNRLVGSRAVMLVCCRSLSTSWSSKTISVLGAMPCKPSRLASSGQGVNLRAEKARPFCTHDGCVLLWLSEGDRTTCWFVPPLGWASALYPLSLLETALRVFFAVSHHTSQDPTGNDASLCYRYSIILFARARGTNVQLCIWLDPTCIARCRHAGRPGRDECELHGIRCLVSRVIFSFPEL